MKKTSTGFRFSASDLSGHAHCKELTSLNKLFAEGKLKKPIMHDRTLVLLQEKGVEFEHTFLQKLKDEGKSVIEITRNDPDALINTINAMKAGVDVIYQGYLEKDRWMGWSDFLLRCENPSCFGNWSYEILDTKLANETRVGTILQIGLYSWMLQSIQESLPEFMYVENTEGRIGYRVDHYVAYVRMLKFRFEDAITNNIETYPDPVAHCDICNWWEHCNARRRKDDHLSFVAGMGVSQINEVKEHSVNTLSEMAELPLPLPFKPKRGSIGTFEKLREQARLQLQARVENRPVFELLPRLRLFGFDRLPEPSSYDIYLDFEGDPMIEPHGREYITGWVRKKPNLKKSKIKDILVDYEYKILWAETEDQEKLAFESFIDEIILLLNANPEMHIYHFGAYEPSAIKRLMSKYATREEDVDRMLRGGVFVDLHRVVKESLRAGIERYSLKDLEVFHKFLREINLRELGAIKADYEFLLETGRIDEITSEMRDTVQKYNEDDCRSTLSLHIWLESLRAELIKESEVIPRFQSGNGEPNERITEFMLRIQPIFEALILGVPLNQLERNPEQQAHYILANMLYWYKREEKSFWWEVYRLKELPAEELLEEGLALSFLTYTGNSFSIARSTVFEYSFPPQECEFKVGAKLNTRDGVRAGDIYLLDMDNGILQIKKGPSITKDHPSEVFSFEYFDPKEKIERIISMAEWVLKNGVDNPDPYLRAGRDLLLRKEPRYSASINHKGGILKTIEKTLKLDNSILPIQGPPGAGKSYTASKLIIELVKNKKRVGITALSHKVIHNLLEKINQEARLAKQTIRIAQKPEQGFSGNAAWEIVSDSKTLIANINNFDVIAGTSFMWAGAGFTSSVDYLFVDEAGQLSLIDTLAISHATSNLVLLGDPQQLKQPQQGIHPEGTEVSALEHILNDSNTISEEKGVFLGESWRMHPSICDFDSILFYDGKLKSRPGLELQQIKGKTSFAGSGLFFDSVLHKGNSNKSMEEVDRIEEIVNELCNGKVKWVDKDSREQVLKSNHIKIISPFNAQVNALKERMPEMSIGTVDKFQGQEAPVIIFSMASSSAKEAPRGMEFLFSPNRFNVAVSRARAVFIMVGNPEILEPDCNSPHQVKLANAFCMFAERAKINKLQKQGF
ncbi:MAG: recombinase RecB [Flavobacterium sp. BFFFF2]|nr:MAG: recombinase RecB [Flavobacterium sp. BFFFF2]